MSIDMPEATTETSHSGPEHRSNDLKQLLNLKSIAVIGASEDQSKFGGRLFKNLLRHGFSGTVYPINAGRAQLFDIKAYPDLASLPTTPDAFILALPSHLVKDQVVAAAQRGIKLGIIISSGFSDAGEEGKRLEQEIVALAHAKGMRLIGPNCLGVINTETGATLCSSPILERNNLPRRPIGFVSQSGALMTTAFDKAWSTGGGFTHGFSVGNQADLEVCDFIDFMVKDDATQVICAYIEGVKDAKRFLASARSAHEAGKPLLIVKAGRSQAGQEAAFSHTASIAGDAAVFAAVCREQGALVVDDINIMLSVASMLASQPHRSIRRTAIVTPSGGGGALAADALSEASLELAQFSDKTRETLSAHYPPGQIKNPLDFGTRIGQDENLSAEATALAVQQDPNVDAVLCVTAMAPVRWQLQVVESQAKMARIHKKPIIVAIDAGQTSDPVRARLTELNIPYTNSTADAIKTLAYVKQWNDLRPASAGERPQGYPATPHELASGQYDEHQTKALLATYGIPVNEGAIATSADEAAAIAARLAFPVVLKIVSADIIHKSDVGGVIIRLNTEEEVRAAYVNMLQSVKKHQPNAKIEGVLVQRMLEGHLELIVGGRNDEEFGPVILFGAGGILVEVLPDKYLATAPLSADAVRQGLETLTIWKVLEGYRGKKVALDKLVDIIVRLSWLMHDLRDRNFEIDINPVLVGAEHATAVDARLLLG